MKRCIYCHQDYPLIDFRRYTYGKVREMSACNFCRPPKRLSQMTPKEREAALQTTHRNYSTALVERLNERDAAKKKETLSRKTSRHYLTTRRRNWDTAIIKQAREEYRWAYTTLLRYKTKAAGNAQRNAQRAPYVKFFDEYARILKRMVLDMEARSNAPDAPLNPTEEDKNPLSYVDPTYRLGLKELFSGCKPIPGTRPAREPWFLYWRE